MLSGIVAELEPEHIYRLLHATAADDDVFVMDRFRAAGQNAVAISVAAIFNYNTLIFTVFGKLVSIYTLSALENHRIVVDVEAAALDQHVRAGIDVNSIGAWCSNGSVWSANGTIQILYVVAFIDMGGPEVGILQRCLSNSDVA